MEQAKELRLTDEERERAIDLLARGSETVANCVEFNLIGWTTKGGRRMTHFRHNGGRTRAYASKLAYAAHCGDAPAGMLVIHTCDNPPCVKPAHLRLGTGKDNSDDMNAKGRRAHKYSDEQIAEAVRLRRGGMTLTRVRDKTGISISHISRMAKRSE